MQILKKGSLLLLLIIMVLITSCTGGKNSSLPNDYNEEGGGRGRPYEYDFSSASGQVSLAFDKALYDAGDTAHITLNLEALASDEISEKVGIIVVSPYTDSAESVSLKKIGQTSYTGLIHLTADKGEDNSISDGVLYVSSGKAIQAHFYVPKRDPFSGLAEDLVVATSLIRVSSESNSNSTISDELNTVFDLTSIPVDSGVLVSEKFGHVVLDSHRVIYYPTSEKNFNDFFDFTRGESLDAYLEGRAVYPNTYTKGAYYLVDLERFFSDYDSKDLATLRAFLGDDGTIIVNDMKILRLYAGVLALRMKGFLASVNPALQSYSVPSLGSNEDGNESRKMYPRNCIPNSSGAKGESGKECLLNVPAVWAYNNITGNRYHDVSVAIIDSGFKVNDDWGGLPKVECDATGSVVRGVDVVCAEGIAQHPPAAPTSGGGLVWHGNGVVSAISARLDNNNGGSGVAGQVATPYLYHVNTYSYVFGLNKAIDNAVEKKASCINISAGYPCRLLTNIGPDFDICTPDGRSELCVAVGLTTSIATKVAAAAVCTTTGLIPLLGQVACVASTVAAVTVDIVASSTCMAQLALGEIDGPLHRAIRRAYLKGVPIVVSAGNKGTEEQFPKTIRKIIDFSSYNTDDWRVVPAVYPEVITVGAVNEDTFKNEHFVGESIDVWAPIGSSYWAPSSATDINSPLAQYEFGGTSDAAPYVTGVIANMMANNEALIPKNLKFTDYILGDDVHTGPANVEKIRAILKDTAFTQEDIRRFNPAFQDDEVRRLINPIGAVLGANPGVIDHIRETGFPVDLGFADHVDRVITLKPKKPKYGTVVALTERTADIDTYRVDVPQYVRGGTNLYRINFRVKEPYESHYVMARPSNTSVMIRHSNEGQENKVSTEEYSYYVLRTKDKIDEPSYIKVSGNGVYGIELSSVEARGVGFTIDAPEQNGFCKGAEIEILGSAFTSEGEKVPYEFVSWDVTLKTDSENKSVPFEKRKIDGGESSIIKVALDRVGVYVIEISAGDYKESIRYQTHDCTNSDIIYPYIRLTSPSDDIYGKLLDGKWYHTFDNGCTEPEDFVNVALQLNTHSVLLEGVDYDRNPNENRYPNSAFVKLRELELLYRQVGDDRWTAVPWVEDEGNEIDLPLTKRIRLVYDDEAFEGAHFFCRGEAFEVKARLTNKSGITVESQTISVIPIMLN